MSITRTAIVDDDGSNTLGTAIDYAWKDELYDQIDDAIDGPDASVRSVALGGTGASTLTGLLKGNGTGAITAHSLTAHGVVIGNGTGTPAVTAVGATGEVLTGVTGGDPVWAAPAGGGTFTEQTTTATGAQNNFDLNAHLTYLRCTGAAPIFSGFTVMGGAPAAGDRVIIDCLGTTAKVTNQDTNSTAANRIIGPSTAGQILGANGRMECVYDDTTDRWRVECLDPGAWIVPAFNAGDFTASGSMTLTVQSGDVNAYSYQQRGKSLTMSFRIQSTTVGGTPSQELRISTQGFVFTRQGYAPLAYGVDNGVVAAGLIVANATAAYAAIYKDLTLASNWSASTNATGFYGSFTFEVD